LFFFFVRPRRYLHFWVGETPCSSLYFSRVFGCFFLLFPFFLMGMSSSLCRDTVLRVFVFFSVLIPRTPMFTLSAKGFQPQNFVVAFPTTPVQRCWSSRAEQAPLFWFFPPYVLFSLVFDRFGFFAPGARLIRPRLSFAASPRTTDAECFSYPFFSPCPSRAVFRGFALAGKRIDSPHDRSLPQAELLPCFFRCSILQRGH